LAVLAAIGGGAAIGTSIYATWSTMRGGHPTSTYFFFSLWGIAALAGAAANIATYFQSGDPPEKPPRGGSPRRSLSIRAAESARITGASAKPLDRGGCGALALRSVGLRSHRSRDVGRKRAADLSWSRRFVALPSR
jgi:hypothetical protein